MSIHVSQCRYICQWQRRPYKVSRRVFLVVPRIQVGPNLHTNPLHYFYSLLPCFRNNIRFIISTSKTNINMFYKHVGIIQIHKYTNTSSSMFGVDGRRVVLKVILSLVEGSHLLTPSVCLFDIGAVCFYNMTDVRSDDHYNSDECVPGYSFGR